MFDGTFVQESVNVLIPLCAVKTVLGMKDTLNLSFSKYQHRKMNVTVFNYGINLMHRY